MSLSANVDDNDDDDNVNYKITLLVRAITLLVWQASCLIRRCLSFVSSTCNENMMIDDVMMPLMRMNNVRPCLSIIFHNDRQPTLANIKAPRPMPHHHSTS